MSGCFCLQCVHTQEVAVLEDLGQFKNLLKPGLNITLWPISQIAGRLSLRIQQLDVVCETKTKDNVFIQVAVAVQFRVLVEKAYDAFYRLTDPKGQIQAYVFDVIRSTVPKMELDEAFASKAEIASATLEQLKDVMNVSWYLFQRYFMDSFHEKHDSVFLPGNTGSVYPNYVTSSLTFRSL
jgi:regulator of protease activity HflC (stomatin/prohibitin superfamily)